MDEDGFDRIGYWSEIKLDIIEKYASAYSRILATQREPTLYHVYIDGFSGAGEHVSRESNEIVLGSPTLALRVEPPFREYFFVDLDGDKVEHLRSLVGDRSDVHIQKGDCNQVLLDEVFPRVRFEDYRRGLCLLDPYALHLQWGVIREAGRLRTIDLFLNFPLLAMNRNVLRHDQTGVSPQQAARMTAFWGDESWRTEAYRASRQMGLFSESMEKVGNEDVARAFQQRLREVAGFRNVPTPLPMRNSLGRVIYYLFFASQNDTGNRIVEQIFDKYRNRGA